MLRLGLGIMKMDGYEPRALPTALRCGKKKTARIARGGLRVWWVAWDRLALRVKGSSSELYRQHRLHNGRLIPLPVLNQLGGFYSGFLGMQAPFYTRRLIIICRPSLTKSASPCSVCPSSRAMWAGLPGCR